MLSLPAVFCFQCTHLGHDGVAGVILLQDNKSLSILVVKQTAVTLIYTHLGHDGVADVLHLLELVVVLVSLCESAQ